MQLFLPLFAVVFISLFGCQKENSSSRDEGLYGGTGSVEFLAAKTVLSACNSCHGYASMTESDLKLAKTSYPSSATPAGMDLIIPGNAESSPLYYRLANSSGSGTPKNMPSGGSLGSSDLDVIKAWINSL